jgi:hypothetical protein
MSAIKTGDLVVVVKVPCACLTYCISKIGNVLDIFSHDAKCGLCQKSLGNLTVAEITGSEGSYYLPVTCLKKIDPLDEPETVEETNEVTV